MRILLFLPFFLSLSDPFLAQIRVDPVLKGDAPPAIFGSQFLETDSIFEVFDVEKLPVFPGGEKELVCFLAQNIWWPKDCDCAHGIIAVQFVVDTLGECCNGKILKTPGRCFEPVVAAIFAKMPCWSPSEIRGRKVPVRFMIPIRVHLE